MREGNPIKQERTQIQTEEPLMFTEEEVDAAQRAVYARHKITLHKPLLRQIGIMALKEYHKGVEFGRALTYALNMYLNQYPHEPRGAYREAVVKMCAARKARLKKKGTSRHRRVELWDESKNKDKNTQSPHQFDLFD